ncbi:MAG: LysM peptidoglycan-binding domain-containing protein [Thermoanaerobaculia bacterium]
MADSRVGGVVVALAVGALFVGVAAAPGQVEFDVTTDTPEGYSTGFHIVRPGENLRKISRDYLGSQELWELNWELNPEVGNPDFLLPGQRLLVLMKLDSSVPSAQVVSLSGRVEGRPVPIGWNPARRQDIVVESDGMRTFEASSTALKFHDGSSLVMTEQSIVFLKRAGRTLQGIETRSVEIVEGQADLAGGAPSGAGGTATPGIEFVIGDATATPRPSAESAAEARLRKSDEGTAQLMVYQGESEVAAGGTSLSVPTGMGTSVPRGEPPRPPEKLLPEPGLTAPAAGASLELYALDFSWAAVEGAVGYTIEVCRDASCEALIARATGIERTEWRADGLPLGDQYWRVTATSPSGLDGYPAASRPVRVEPTRAEFDPPIATFSVAGRSVERDGKTFFNPAARVLAEVSDPSGVAEWQPLVDGRLGKKPALEGPWSTGTHEVAVLAEDNLGNRGRTDAVSFTVDGEGPEIGWKVGDSPLLEDEGQGGLESPKSRWWLAKAAKRNARRVSRGREPRWTLVGWGNRHLDNIGTFENPDRIRGLYRNYRVARLAGEEPRLLLLAPGIVSVSGEAGQFLVVDAVDLMSGVEELSVRTVGSKSEGYRLEATARDRLGNASRTSWSFDSADR